MVKVAVTEMIGCTVPDEGRYSLRPFGRLAVKLRGQSYYLDRVNNAELAATSLNVRGQPVIYIIGASGDTHLWPIPDRHYPLETTI